MEARSDAQLMWAMNSLARVVVATRADSADWWISELADAFFDVSHCLRRDLRSQRIYRDLVREVDDESWHGISLADPATRRCVREQFLIEIVDGLELELHERRLRMRSLKPRQQSSKLGELRHLGTELLQVLEEFRLEATRSRDNNEAARTGGVA